MMSTEFQKAMGPLEERKLCGCCIELRCVPLIVSCKLFQLLLIRLTTEDF